MNGLLLTKSTRLFSRALLVTRKMSSSVQASSSASGTSKALAFDRNGDPEQVLSLKDLPLRALGPGDVHVRILAAPINPSDINTVEGTYPLQPKLPDAVGGHEGLGIVEAVGKEVSKLSVGDWVVPVKPAQGTWRESGIFAHTDWHNISKDLPVAGAATACINPTTALLMLESFEELKEGDVVVQNGATSAVGQYVIQLAHSKGLRTVNIIRPRTDWDATVQHLKSLGADVVTTEEDAKKDVAAAGLPEAALGLNCVGGSAATAVAKLLRPGATHVTYGGMAKQPVIVGTGMLIFKDIAFRGFWLSGNWSKRGNQSETIDRVIKLIQDGKLQVPKVKEYPLSQWKDAFAEVKRDHRGHKILLTP